MVVRGASPFYYPPSPLPVTIVGSSMAADYCPSHIVHSLGDIDPFRTLVEREKERTFTIATFPPASILANPKLADAPYTC